MNKKGFVAKRLIVVSLLFQLTALSGLAQKGIDAKLSGYKPQVLRGQSTELKVFGKNLAVQSVEISPAEGILVREIKESVPDPNDKRQQKEGIKVWSFLVVVEKTSQPGERSVVIVTPQGRSEPQTIRLVTHIPVISDLKILSATPADCKVEFTFSVLDEVGDIEIGDIGKSTVSMFVFGSSTGFATTKSPTEIVGKGAKRTVRAVVSSPPGGNCNGTTTVKIKFQDNSGYDSNTLEAQVEFK